MPTVDWPPTGQRDEHWVCPQGVAECPNREWCKTHLHWRKFASLKLATKELRDASDG